jgi:hypothetical protein
MTLSAFDEANKRLLDYNLAKESGRVSTHKRNGETVSLTGFAAAWSYDSGVPQFNNFGEQLKNVAMIAFSLTYTVFPRKNDVLINTAGDEYIVVEIAEHDEISATVMAIKLDDVSTGHLGGK